MNGQISGPADISELQGYSYRIGYERGLKEGAAERDRYKRERDELAKALAELKRYHRVCEDSWYSCPLSEEGCANPNDGNECTCGADLHNAKINALLSTIKD